MPWTLDGDLEITSAFSQSRRGVMAGSNAPPLLDCPVQTPRIIVIICCVLTHIKSITPELRHKLDAFIQILIKGPHVLLLHDLHVLLMCY